jgi:hypothetical protein
MNIKIFSFFDICKEFFDLMHSPYIYYEYEEKKEEVWDEEKGFIAYKESLENVDRKINTWNLCNIVRKVLLYINPKIYKELDDVKVE